MAARAWLLNFGHGLKAAVGLHEMSQIMLSSSLHKIPTTPFYASEILILEERVLPVVDVPKLLSGNATMTSSNDIIGIAVYQGLPNEPAHYGGLRLAGLPTSIDVEDIQACDLPESMLFWQPLSISCFSHNKEPIPVVDLSRVFSADIHAIVPDSNVLQ